MLRAAAPAKLNLALVVGPLRDDGKHELVTIVEKLALSDTITVVQAPALQVEGFAGDTLVRDALVALAERAGADASFAATIQKHIPVTAGLGGGSSDAAATLRLANGLLGEPLADPDLHALAAGLGADLPLFLVAGGVLATGDGTSVAPLTLPRDYHVVLWIPHGETKESTASVYRRFDERGGEQGFDERRLALLDALTAVTSAADLAGLPENDLASSPAAQQLLEHGAFRADVSGAGPALYGLFLDAADAAQAARALGSSGRVWTTAPAGAGDP